MHQTADDHFWPETFHLIDQNQGHPTQMLEVPQWFAIGIQLLARLPSMIELAELIRQLYQTHVARSIARREPGEERRLVFHLHHRTLYSKNLF